MVPGDMATRSVFCRSTAAIYPVSVLLHITWIICPLLSTTASWLLHNRLENGAPDLANKGSLKVYPTRIAWQPVSASRRANDSPIGRQMLRINILITSFGDVKLKVVKYAWSWTKSLYFNIHNLLARSSAKPRPLWWLNELYALPLINAVQVVSSTRRPLLYATSRCPINSWSSYSLKSVFFGRHCMVSSLPSAGFDAHTSFYSHESPSGIILILEYRVHV